MNIRSLLTLSLIISLACILGNSRWAAAKGKPIIGRVERITLPDLQLSFDGRIDTGARSSSMHVINEKILLINGEQFIQFNTIDSKGKNHYIRTKIHKKTNVRSSQGEEQERYVIREKVKIGSIEKTVNITLNDRGKLKYNFLVGRNFLRGLLVDVSLSHNLSDLNE